MLALAMFIPTTSVMAQSHKMADDAQVREEMRIHFRASKTYIDKSYMNNDSALQQIVEWAEKRQRDSMVDVVSVAFYGACSPEGSVSFNHYLSSTRLSRLENYVRQRVNIPENIIIRNDHYIAWEELEKMVEESNIENKDEILAILRSENTSTGEQLDSRIRALKNMDNGKTWNMLLNRYFAHMRNAYMVIVTKKSELAERLEELRTPMPLTKLPSDQNVAIKPASIIPAAVAAATKQSHYMYVKTNIVGLALLNANVGIEFDLGNYLSFNLPVSYSAVNYFTPTIKFRNFSIQPELRVWPMKNNDGLFIGAHMGFAYYNFAFDGDWRYQDHDGKSPTLGGGLSLGYRLPISANKNWKLEFAVGAGFYPLHYDVFHNLKNVKEGLLYETRNGNYIGLDNVTIGISYRIPYKKNPNPLKVK
jgi:hypothetical protein